MDAAKAGVIVCLFAVFFFWRLLYSICSVLSVRKSLVVVCIEDKVIAMKSRQMVLQTSVVCRGRFRNIDYRSVGVEA